MRNDSWKMENDQVPTAPGFSLASRNECSQQRENPLRSPLRGGFLLLVAYLRYDRGDRSSEFFGSPPALSPSLAGLHCTDNREGCRSFKLTNVRSGQR